MRESCSGAIQAIILAAGPSSRFGESNKLLAEVDGRPMLQRVVESVMGGGVGQTVVVTGADHPSISSLLRGSGVEVVRNERWAEGMGTSLAKGALALEEGNSAGILVCLGDLPFLSSRMVRRVIGAFRHKGGERIVVPKVKGRRGHPVVFPMAYRAKLMQLAGDTGAKSILNQAGPRLSELKVNSQEIVRDIDTRSELRRLKKEPQEDTEGGRLTAPIRN